MGAGSLTIYRHPHHTVTSVSWTKEMEQIQQKDLLWKILTIFHIFFQQNEFLFEGVWLRSTRTFIIVQSINCFYIIYVLSHTFRADVFQIKMRSTKKYHKPNGRFVWSLQRKIFLRSIGRCHEPIPIPFRLQIHEPFVLSVINSFVSNRVLKWNLFIPSIMAFFSTRNGNYHHHFHHSTGNRNPCESEIRMKSAPTAVQKRGCRCWKPKKQHHSGFAFGRVRTWKSESAAIVYERREQIKNEEKTHVRCVCVCLWRSRSSFIFNITHSSPLHFKRFE